MQRSFSCVLGKALKDSEIVRCKSFIHTIHEVILFFLNDRKKTENVRGVRFESL